MHSGVHLPHCGMFHFHRLFHQADTCLKGKQIQVIVWFNKCLNRLNILVDWYVTVLMDKNMKYVQDDCIFDELHTKSLTFTLFHFSSVIRVARFQSKASFADAVITALCVGTCWIQTTNIFLFTFIYICTRIIKKCKNTWRRKLTLWYSPDKKAHKTLIARLPLHVTLSSLWNFSTLGEEMNPSLQKQL